MWGEAMNRYIKKILSLMLILVFVLAQMNLNINIKKVKADENSDSGLTKLKILEIEPGDHYVLDQSMFSSNVDITQMPMSEFIGKIENINGLYDIVYIGNNVYEKDVPTLFNGIKDYNKYTIKYSKVGTKANNTGIDFGAGDENSHGYTEYFSENDITNKKAKELVDFIKSGQLFLFDESIFQDQELSGSKLWENFGEYQEKYNFKTVGSNLTAGLIMSYYNDSSKRPVLNIESSPLTYNGNLQNYNSDKNMNFVFDISGSNSHTFTTRLYCDMNGDGLFKDYENYASLKKQRGGNNLEISYTVPQNFGGLMPWKLEATDDDTGAKSYQCGYTLYKSDSVTPIRVLQIYPNGSSLNLKSDLTQAKLQMSGYYNIKVTEKYCNDFNWQCDAAERNGNIDSVLNGKYDMVIIGFADTYGGCNFSDSAADALIDFIKTGQSLMLTHDTLSVNMYKKSYGYTLNKRLRDYIGQSRYVDENNPSEVDYDGSQIPHDDYPDKYGQKSYGFTKNMISAYNNCNNGENTKYLDMYQSFYAHNEASKVNDGVFSEYPYVLKDNLNISKTHFQYFQLNLEDENVVPWYDLSGQMSQYTSPADENDPRNYYYTYSKGNITYSGTGHSSPRGNQDEQEMFVNTMVKAARTANHAPTVNVLNLNDGQYVSKNQSSLDFSFTAQDPDENDEKKDALRRKIYINDTPIDETGNSVSDYKKMTSGDEVKVSIPKDRLNELAGSSSEVTVKIEVLDTQNAKGEKTITFKYVDEPSLSASVFGLKNGYLVGDTAQTSLSVNAENSSNGVKDTMFLSNDNQAAIQDDGLSLNCINTSNDTEAKILKTSDLNLKDINFTPQVDNQNTAKNFTFKFENEGIYKVENLFKYNFLNLDNKVQRSYEYDYNLNVKEGDIYIKCVDSSGRVFTPSVGINVTRQDGGVESKTTDSTGGAQFLKEPSGSYSISVQNNTGYTLTDPSTQSVSLSYDNPNQTIILHFQTLVSPSIEVDPSCNSNEWNNTDVKVTLVKPTNFVDKLQKMQYKIDDGDWTDYTDEFMLQKDGQHKVKARTVDDSSGGESTASEKAVNIDQTKPPKPDIVNSDGDVCINSANISIYFNDDETNGSGIDKMEYKLDDGDWIESDSKSKDIEIDNNCTVYAREEDKAGNYSDTTKLEVNITHVTNDDIELEGLTFNTIPEGGHVNFNIKVKIGTNEDGTPKYAVPSNKITATVQSKDISIIDIEKNNDNLDPTKNDGVVDKTDNSRSIGGVVAGDGNKTTNTEGDTITAFGMIGAANKQTDIVVTLEKKDGKAITLTKTIKVVGSESGLLY